MARSDTATSLPTRRLVRINVRTLSCSKLVLHLDQDETVDQLQAHLEERLAIPVSQQIICNRAAPNRRLTRGHFLCEYNLGLEDEVLVMQGLPPVPPIKAPDFSEEVKAILESRQKGHKKSGRSISSKPGSMSSKPGTSGTGGTSDRASECEARDKSPHPGSGVAGGVTMIPSAGASSRGPSEERSLRKPAQEARTITPPGQWAQQRAPSAPEEGGASERSRTPVERSGVAASKAGQHSVPSSIAGPKSAAARSGSRDRQGPHTTATSHGSSHSAPVSRAGGGRSQRIRRGDLECVGRLGVGAFGVVTLEEDRRTGKTYALKAVSKGYLVQLRMVHSVLNEKRILKMVDSPFIVKLFTTYNGREHVYFLLEAALGGELFTTYERLRLYGSERHARFYVGCVVEALVHLHDRGVIYRDLKPENLLLDNRGYCKLTDMGLAKVTKGPTYTLVGTPDYMAPEVINGTGHNQAVDWWMLGVLLFEFMVGRPPFEADSADQVYELVRKGIERVHFPPECRHPAPDLVRALCRTNPEARLCTPRLRRDPWFHGFDWASLREQRMQPPRVPTVRNQRDLSNFRTCDNQGDPPLVPYQDTGTNWDADFEDDLVNTQQVVPTTQLRDGAASGNGAQAVPSPPPWAFTQAMAKAPGSAQLECGLHHLVPATEPRSPGYGGG